MKDIQATVRFLRLNTGEDLIAYAYHIPKDDVEDGHYVINDPLKIVYITNTSSGKPVMSISLMQWIFTRICDKQEFKIAEKDVLTTVEPSLNLVEFYYKTVDHFNKVREEQKRAIQFSNEVEEDDESEFDEDDYTDEAEGLEMLKDILNMVNKPKKNLH